MKRGLPSVVRKRRSSLDRGAFLSIVRCYMTCHLIEYNQLMFPNDSFHLKTLNMRKTVNHWFAYTYLLLSIESRTIYVAISKGALSPYHNNFLFFLQFRFLTSERSSYTATIYYFFHNLDSIWMSEANEVAIATVYFFGCSIYLLRMSEANECSYTPIQQQFTSLAAI